MSDSEFPLRKHCDDFLRPSLDPDRIAGATRDTTGLLGLSDLKKRLTFMDIGGSGLFSYVAHSMALSGGS